MTTMTPRTSRRFPRLVLAAAAFLGACIALATPTRGADLVILNDGFTLEGKWHKETELLMDVGRPVRINKANGFDLMEDGPKFVVFSTHSQRGGKVEQSVARPEWVGYNRKPADIPRFQLPGMAAVAPPTPFNDKWVRSLKVTTATGAFEVIRQQVVKLNPNETLIASISHNWIVSYHTTETDPRVVRQLLSTHPDLLDVGGIADPQRRMNIAAFFKDVGKIEHTYNSRIWFSEARKELETTKKACPGVWDKDATERFGKLTDEIDRAETQWGIVELETAVGSGRYDFAKTNLSGFAAKGADNNDAIRLSKLKADIETIQPKYELTVRLLRELLDREAGESTVMAHAAGGGGPAYLYAPRPKMNAMMTALAEGASAVLAELHPDSLARVELFTDSASQAELRRKEGKDAIDRPPELLAMAISGWLKGKNGGNKDIQSALRCWATRQMSVSYLREPIGNNRRIALDSYLKSSYALAPDELAQIITLLPPPFPEDLAAPQGKPVKKDDASGVDRIYRRNTGSLPGAANGYDYYFRLPAEYHHGRAYPVILALNSPLLSGEMMVAQLAEFADRFGYIIAAPIWCGEFKSKTYDYSGQDHVWVTAVQRDLLRRFQVDPDKCFLFGFGDGANFALDIGLARPDLFAAVVAMGPNPPLNIYMEYWKNNQKLPTYIIAGELSGAFSNLRKLFEKWVPKGFPALLTVYKGRGNEWFRSELPRTFDWMGRKTRVRGTASLRLNNPGFETWQVLRETDTRFYWVGVGEGGLRQGNLLANWQNGNPIAPAQFRADLSRGVITIDQSRGIKKFVIWLERDLIDWSKEIRISVNGAQPLNYRPKKLTPDLSLMFEELYKTGDRKLLFLGKIEIEGPN